MRRFESIFSTLHALLELVEELSHASDDFRQMWARHDVRAKTHDTIRFRHRRVGELTLSCDVFSVDNAPGQKLVVCQAEPGSDSERALSRLNAFAEPRAR
ncbi:hypothetical protein GCM10023194_08600 [Planotetraspora phitsanulokensis]|uniref:MmyB-like transcription regulator ligand binding domain-containing protein n=1 Tax=Planotetraspora phitsanulokensis TaxID=575192 RepID=A0A8J3U797_9ACTN|nr:hypothetical protein [Planotetraspora phitsanulokensis]GII39954.1 hypothetical protein Pph01_49570 [Planotetraspora phitsanulokensis]